MDDRHSGVGRAAEELSDCLSVPRIPLVEEAYRE